MGEQPPHAGVEPMDRADQRERDPWARHRDTRADVDHEKQNESDDASPPASRTAEQGERREFIALDPGVLAHPVRRCFPNAN